MGRRFTRVRGHCFELFFNWHTNMTWIVPWKKIAYVLRRTFFGLKIIFITDELVVSLNSLPVKPTLDISNEHKVRIYIYGTFCIKEVWCDKEDL